MIRRRCAQVSAGVMATGLLGLPAASGWAAPAHAIDQRATVPATGGEEMTILTGAGPATFRVADPEAPSSPAERDDRIQIKPDGTSVGWTPGWTIRGRVIVRSDGRDAGIVEAAVRNAPGKQAFKGKVTPAVQDGRGGPLAAFFYVDVGSVREAVELAAGLAGLAGIDEAYVDVGFPKALRSTLPTDPGFSQQWHLLNATNPSADINVEAAWKAGFTGEGVTVGILEAGWDISHDDLSPNHDAEASQPPSGSLDHGTATAGLVAAVANNGIGGAGVAYGGKVSRLYYGTASEIADAFGFRNDLNKIKSNSWGPFDNGFIASMSSIERAAVEDAAVNGRGGLGTVIVWAAGNGGQSNDRLDYDGYGSNRFAMAIGSIDFFDRHSVYSEPGSALMLVTTSDFDLVPSDEPGIYTTWSFNGYTNSFGGTSAAAPIAAGVAALVLQANPGLTWRDVQHVMIRSARRVNPSDESWIFNGAGAGVLRAWSEFYGFGAVDAGAAVALASNWTNRPPESSVASPLIVVNTAIPDANQAGVTSTASITGRLLAERVQVTLTAPHSRIGQLRITLTSPSGTTVTLASTRFDNTPGGYNQFTFHPAAFWDERAAGTWTLKVADEVAVPANTGTLSSWQLTVYGHEPACWCDWNLSGDLSIQDLFDFLASYFAGKGDFSGDGVIGMQDLFDFLACWFGGC